MGSVCCVGGGLSVGEIGFGRLVCNKKGFWCISGCRMFFELGWGSMGDSFSVSF